MVIAPFVAAVLLQSSASLAPESFTAEVTAFAAAADPDARFEALTGLLRVHGLTFTVEPFTLDKPVESDPRTTGRNIVVSVGQGSRELVVGAHWDAIRLPDGTFSKGAVDNAASAVMLVHLAAALQQEPPTTRVTLVWFDLEELGLVGSAKYIEAHGTAEVHAMLNFDINAYGDTTVYAMPPGGDNAPLRQSLREVCAREDLECVRFPSLPFSDDRPFGKADVPTLTIASLPQTELHQMWLLMNAGPTGRLIPGTQPGIFRTVHSAEDVVDKVDATTIVRVLRLALALVRHLSR